MLASALPRHRYSYEEYLRLEETSSVKHEYLDGEIYARAGGTPDHAALAGAIVGILRARLPAGCRVYTSDLRVRVPATGLSTYPDATIVCGKTQRATDDALAVTNPVVLVEVTSPSTEDYDRGEKLDHYKRLPSVREVLFVSHRSPRLTLHQRNAVGGWDTLEVGPAQSLWLSSLDATLAVDEVYRDGLEDVPPPESSPTIPPPAPPGRPV